MRPSDLNALKWITALKFAGNELIFEACGCRKRKKIMKSDVSDMKWQILDTKLIWSEKYMSNLFKFIRQRMSMKVVVRVSRDGSEFVKVKEM